MKKILLLIFSTILLLSVSLLCIGCGGKPEEGKVSIPSATNVGDDFIIENWEKEKTVTCSQGKTFKLDFSEKDKDGNLYFYDYIVADSQNNKVLVINFEFVADDFGGYTIVYKLKISGKTYIRLVKLNIRDGDAPEAKTPYLPTGFVNQEYTIPSVEVNDKVDGALTPTISVYAKGSQDQPITLVDNKFTPTTTGIYVVKATATDAAGNTLDKEFEFAVRNDINKQILENFDEPSSVLNSCNADAEWLETFEGRDGVLHIPGSPAEKTMYLFKFLRQKSEYDKPFSSITVRLYVQLPEDYPYSGGDFWPAYTSSDPSEDDWTGIAKGQWFDYVITKFGEGDDAFEYLLDKGTSTGGAQLLWTWTKYVDLYVDEIVYSTMTIEGSVQAGFTNTEYDVPEFTVIDSEGEPVIPTVTLFREGEESAPLDISTGKFTATKVGKYIFKVEAVDNCGNTEVKEFDFLIREEADPSVMENFDCEESLANSINANGQTWLETFEGRNGVIAIDHASIEGWGIQQFYFNFLRPVDEYKALTFNSIIVSMYIESENYSGQDFYQFGGEDYLSIASNQWVEINLSNWLNGDKNATLDALVNDTPLFWGWAVDGTTPKYTKVYIDEIYADVIIPEEEGVLESFSNARDLKYADPAWVAEGEEKAWLETFQGKNGVIMLNDNKSSNGYNFRIVEDLASKVWDYIEFTVYIPSTSVDNPADVWLNWCPDIVPFTDNGTVATPVAKDNGAIESWPVDQWVNIRLPKTLFNTPAKYNEFISNFTTGGLNFFWGYGITQIYIDCITYGVNA